MLKANIETFLACDASYEEAGIVLYGAPLLSIACTCSQV